MTVGEVMIKEKRTPYLTLLIILANIVVAFLLIFDTERKFDYGFRTLQPTLLTAFTSLFLHLNTLHLLGNMVFLAAVGPAVEAATGWWKTLLVYILSGLAGVAVHWLFRRHVDDIVIGASGCVAGCIGYVSVRYMKYRVPLVPKIGAPIWIVVAIWAILQVAGGFIQIGDQQSGTAFWAHAGGFVAGLVFSLIFRAPSMASLQSGHETLEEMNERSPAARLAAAEAVLKDHPNDVRALWRKADAEHDLAHAESESETLTRLLDHVAEVDLPKVVARLSERGYLNAITSVRRMQLADKLKSENANSAEILLKSVIEGPQGDDQIPDAILALASLLGDKQPDLAAELLLKLKQDFPLHAASDVARARGLIR